MHYKKKKKSSSLFSFSFPIQTQKQNKSGFLKKIEHNWVHALKQEQTPFNGVWIKNYFCFSWKYILVEKSLDICTGKQDKNPDEEHFFALSREGKINEQVMEIYWKLHS